MFYTLVSKFKCMDCLGFVLILTLYNGDGEEGGGRISYGGIVRYVIFFGFGG